MAIPLSFTFPSRVLCAVTKWAASEWTMALSHGRGENLVASATSVLGDEKPALSCALLISSPRTAFTSSLHLSRFARGWWSLPFCPLPLVFFSPGPSLQALLPSPPSEPLLHPPQISEHTCVLSSSHLCCQPLLGLLKLYGSVRPRPGGRGRVRPGPAKVGSYSSGGSTVGRSGGPRPCMGLWLPQPRGFLLPLQVPKFGNFQASAPSAAGCTSVFPHTRVLDLFPTVPPATVAHVTSSICGIPCYELCDDIIS